MEDVMKHVDVLDRILRESKRVVCSNNFFFPIPPLIIIQSLSFPNACKAELENLDVRSGELVFDSDRLQDLLDESKRTDLELFKDLTSRLVKIHQRVNMDVSVCA